jgi:hypothetical protein
MAGARALVGGLVDVGVIVGWGDSGLGVGVGLGVAVRVGEDLSRAGCALGVGLGGLGVSEGVGKLVDVGDNTLVEPSLTSLMTGIEEGVPAKLTNSAVTQPSPPSAPRNSICHQEPSEFRPTAGAVSPGDRRPRRE